VEVGTIAQWAGACATFLAVLVALFKKELTSWLRRPKLELSVVLESPHCQIMPVQYEAQRVAPTLVQTNCCYLRLWVENKGKTRAEKVQVFAAKLSRRVADGRFIEEANFLPMNLCWSHGKIIGNNREMEVYAEGISPQMGKQCDIGHIVNPANRKDWGEDLPGLVATNTLLALALEVPITTRSHLLAPGTYRLELRTAAANSSPVIKILELTLTGNWFDDPQKMFNDGIGMRVLP
jgi:hypothetical protein